MRDRTRVYHNEFQLPISAREFVKSLKVKDENKKYIEVKDSLNNYKKAVRTLFKKHVKERLEKYRPKLVICTGANYKETFKELF